MKGRESGMPDEAYWDSFFQPDCVLEKLGCTSAVNDAVEFGCGYGTFTIPAAQRISGSIFALDIDPAMTAATMRKAQQRSLANVVPVVRDFLTSGTGLADASVDYAMLFNIVHVEEPMFLLREARRIVAPGGLVGVVHWRSDIETPRGPSLAIRPTPQQCALWGEEAGLELVRHESLTCCMWHWGLVLRSPFPAAV
jgi:SAM-dependent methyltransferase